MSHLVLLPRTHSCAHILALWSLLGIDSGFFTHGGENDDVWRSTCQPPDSGQADIYVAILTSVLSLFREELVDLVSRFAVWDLDVVLGAAVV